jgi:hypothetical protein
MNETVGFEQEQLHWGVSPEEGRLSATKRPLLQPFVTPGIRHSIFDARCTRLTINLIAHSAAIACRQAVMASTQ